jgi:MFS superfamily sulfate permease-like transporter
MTVINRRQSMLNINKKLQKPSNISLDSVIDSYGSIDEEGGVDAPQSDTGLSSKGLKSWFPIAAQLSTYSLKLAMADVGAGLCIAFVLLPQAIAYSGLANVDPIRALVSSVYPLIIYALLGASQFLSVGPEAVTSVLVGLAIEKEILVHGGDPNAIGSLLALMCGVLAIGMCVIQAGFIDNILSGYLLTGFVTGAAFLIMSEQLGELFGIRAEHLEGHLYFYIRRYIHVCKIDSHGKAFQRVSHGHIYGWCQLSCLSILSHVFKEKVFSQSTISWVCSRNSMCCGAQHWFVCRFGF